MRIKVCAIQMLPSSNIDKSIDKALSFLSMAAKNGANIACFPELFLNTWFVQSKENGKAEENYKLAEPFDGKTINIMQEYALSISYVSILGGGGHSFKPAKSSTREPSGAEQKDFP